MPARGPGAGRRDRDDRRVTRRRRPGRRAGPPPTARRRRRCWPRSSRSALRPQVGLEPGGHVRESAASRAMSNTLARWSSSSGVSRSNRSVPARPDTRRLPRTGCAGCGGCCRCRGRTRRSRPARAASGARRDVRPIADLDFLIAVRRGHRRPRAGAMCGEGWLAARREGHDLVIGGRGEVPVQHADGQEGSGVSTHTSSASRRTRPGCSAAATGTASTTRAAPGPGHLAGGTGRRAGGHPIVDDDRATVERQGAAGRPVPAGPAVELGPLAGLDGRELLGGHWRHPDDVVVEDPDTTLADGPHASSGWNGRPSLRTTRTSSGA